MIPGGPRNQREMQQMMRRMGMSTEAVPDVEEVIVRTRSKEHVFASPEVTILTVQGVRTYQIVGQPVVRARTASPAAPSPAAPEPASAHGPADEDIRLVMEQANVSREEAVEALFQSNGEPAEAIMKILSRGR
ncbi:MAG TPA: nascent polypeptide-associated complex protein [Thermoplasmata archaeon]|nr:nascent polypeptide-associated complex protein [Thermoplasmata archaeon]